MGTKEDIRTTLQGLMLAHGTRNVDLARALKVSNAAVTNWLNGSNSIDIEKVPLICDFFGITIDDFLSHPSSGRLNEAELRILSMYRSLNAEGKRAMTAAARGVVEEYRQQP